MFRRTYALENFNLLTDEQNYQVLSNISIFLGLQKIPYVLVYLNVKKLILKSPVLSFLSVNFSGK